MAEKPDFDFSRHDYPAFPAADLYVVSLESFKLSDLDQRNLLGLKRREEVLRSCEKTGCFYLNVAEGGDHGKGSMTEDAESLIQVLQPIFTMPKEDKDKYSPCDPLALFGYKRTGVTVVDAHNTPDCAEFFNLSKDDLCRPDTTVYHHSDVNVDGTVDINPPPPTSPTRLNPPILRWPQPVLDHQGQIQAFMARCHEVCLRVLDIISSGYECKRPGAETLRNLHRFAGTSGDHLRVIRGPPRPEPDEEGSQHLHTPSHCDFGTVTLLFNWLGGLQIEHDGLYKWVQPISGHAVVLVGSALACFTQGQGRGLGQAQAQGQAQTPTQGLVLSPCHPVRHRVVSAPGAQGKFPRYALAYLLRPEDDVLIRPLTSGVMRSSEDSNPSVGVGVGVGRARQSSEAPALTAKEWTRVQARQLGIGRDSNSDVGVHG